MTTDRADDRADEQIEAAGFAREIMAKVYGYQECTAFATYQDGKSEPDGWCLTHDRSHHYCREYQAEILRPLTAMVEARDAGLLSTPADQDMAEVERLREVARKFSDDLDFGNGKTEPAASLADIVDPIRQAFSDASDHFECAVICELCGEPLAAKTCEECHGSGCLPNSALAYLECGTCAGAGKIHEGCVEKSYAELVAQRDLLRAQVAAVRALADDWEERGEHDMEFSKQVPEDVQDAIYESGVEWVEKSRLVSAALDAAGGEQS